jgi:predicted secreted protein
MPGLAAYGLTLTGAAAGVIANITNFSGPGISLDTVDVTAHDSTGAWEEVVPTIVRGGEVTFEINYNPTTHHYAGHGLAFNLITRLIDTWTIGGPMGAWSFQGYVTAFEPSAPFDGKMAASCTIKVTGAVTVP